jgi:hypothetical protein
MADPHTVDGVGELAAYIVAQQSRAHSVAECNGTATVGVANLDVAGAIVEDGVASTVDGSRLDGAGQDSRKEAAENSGTHVDLNLGCSRD